ncbi:MAG: zinc-finger domain-containing protein [Casimicrobiaceae bacterium]|nr:zinc-finger domain-containing protein [Casimicrobiaceae bacterium]MCX8098174.1 zinc-finger domain-containing protein [Casimicrobiaceae bacterium]MDW8312778.1 zinc-finger domain-containing protein [Burkholderiales bacterium]
MPNEQAQPTPPKSAAGGLATRPRAVVRVSSKDLQGPGVVFCPNPSMPLWSTHPRVFLDVVKTGSAICPYCGTQYVLEGPAPKGH